MSPSNITHFWNLSELVDDHENLLDDSFANWTCIFTTLLKCQTGM